MLANNNQLDKNGKLIPNTRENTANPPASPYRDSHHTNVSSNQHILEPKPYPAASIKFAYSSVTQIKDH
jgi:hypothetical protein